MASAHGVAVGAVLPLFFRSFLVAALDGNRMSTSLLIQLVAPVVAAFVGGAIGWCLRGLPKNKPTKQREQPRKQAAAQILQSLQAAAETVRSCVEQHTECIRTIQSELNESTSTEPVIITKMAETIIESNG